MVSVLTLEVSAGRSRRGCETRIVMAHCRRQPRNSPQNPWPADTARYRHHPRKSPKASYDCHDRLPTLPTEFPAKHGADTGATTEVSKRLSWLGTLSEAPILKTASWHQRSRNRFLTSDLSHGDRVRQVRHLTCSSQAQISGTTRGVSDLLALWLQP